MRKSPDPLFAHVHLTQLYYAPTTGGYSRTRKLMRPYNFRLLHVFYSLTDLQFDI